MLLIGLLYGRRLYVDDTDGFTAEAAARMQTGVTLSHQMVEDFQAACRMAGVIEPGTTFDQVRAWWKIWTTRYLLMEAAQAARTAGIELDGASGLGVGEDELETLGPGPR